MNNLCWFTKNKRISENDKVILGDFIKKIIVENKGKFKSKCKSFDGKQTGIIIKK